MVRLPELLSRVANDAFVMHPNFEASVFYCNRLSSYVDRTVVCHPTLQPIHKPLMNIEFDKLVKSWIPHTSSNRRQRSYVDHRSIGSEDDRLCVCQHAVSVPPRRLLQRPSFARFFLVCHSNISTYIKIVLLIVNCVCVGVCNAMCAPSSRCAIGRGGGCWCASHHCSLCTAPSTGLNKHR